ncbi:MAG: hypothetical protein IKZ02_06270 [Alphaproteobacteria bacterium]|nr:hypothetical protein [Alphaproteobacteria bacterium]
MTSKKFYYRFKRIDGALIFAILDFVLLCCLGLNHPLLWTLFIATMLLWIYKNFFPQTAVVITDDFIKIDKSNPLNWKDIKSAEIKVVRLFFKDKKVLSLTPKKNIHYTYSLLQKNNCHFGPFPIPLYGVLTLADEEEIIRLVQKKIKIQR